MSFVDYIENKKDFLTCNDVKDLFDVSTFKEESIDTFNKYFEDRKDYKYSIAKIPIGIPSEIEKHTKYYLMTFDNAISFKIIKYSSNDPLFLLDRETKSIIIFDDCYNWELNLLNFELYKENENDNIINYLISNIGEYTIYNFKNIYKEMLNYINIVQEELIKENYNTLYENGRIQVDPNNDSYMLNKIKKDYICHKLFKNDEYINSFDYLSTNIDSVFKRFYDKRCFFLVKYLRDKEYIKELIIKEFNKVLEDINNDKKIHLNKIFYESERYKELYELNKLDIENDIELNKYKAIYEATFETGNTIRVNGEKVENYVNTSDKLNELSIGRYGESILFQDIKTLSFSRKELFNSDKYNQEYQQLA